MPPTHTADFQTAALKATDLDAVEKVNVGLETELVKKHVNIIADAPEIRIQDKTGSAPEVNATTMAIVADGGTTHFRAGTTTFAEGTDTKGNVKFQSSTGATTHAEIVGSSGKLELQDGGLGLKLGSNVSVTGTSKVIQEITGPHARESAVLKKYPEVVFVREKMEYNEDSNTFTQGGYTITSSSNYGGVDTLYTGWRSFTGLTNGYGPGWTSKNNGAYTNSLANGTESLSGIDATTSTGGVSSRDGAWLKLELPTKIKLYQLHVYDRYDDSQGGGSHERVQEAYVYGSNDNSTWYELGKQSTAANNSAYTDDTPAIITINATTAYKYFIIQPTVLSHTLTYASYGQVMYYGYEEVGAGDDSVDTTVKSVYNAPDLTSAALYIDATKPDSNESVTDQSGSGVAVAENNATHDSTENAWELTGAATSNFVSGDLTSLVGDHPHSVSAWVKADQLNGDGLFHVGTADGAGDAASRVGFVDDSHISWGGDSHFFSNAEWHNVTYTYNGEGSDKKLYLDGRRVGTAKNEDTFGEYPPFAMSGYSEYGYTVSASSSHPNYPSHYAFNGSTVHGTSVNIWITDNSRYNASGVGTPTSSADTTVVDGTNQVGEWLQLELPHQLKVSYMDIAPQGQNAGTLDRAPKDGIIAGSRDGSTWETMKSWTGVTDWALDGTSGVYKTFVIDTNTDKAYKYIRIIITKTGGTDAYGALSEVKIYGHRENDLVRFPDPTNTLKYPHVAMTEQARRGYVHTGSSEHSNSSFAGYQGIRNAYVFDDNPATFWHCETNDGTNNQRYNGTDYLYSGINSLGGISGEWLKLQLPRKITLTRVHLRARASAETQAPEDFTIIGSNDDSSWTTIQSFTGESPQDDGTSYYDITSSPAGYKYLAIVIQRLVGTSAASLATLEYYGTEPEDVIARVGDGFDGKVRNLRVFSTALSDARVQEIFDADKDEFGLAKSSVSVYRGHLGIGTSEPKAALTVMDEVGELEEFPPRALTSEETYLEGHGLYKVNFSSQYSANHRAVHLFNRNEESTKSNSGYDTYPWISSGNPDTFSTSTGIASSADSFDGENGPWVELELPCAVNVERVRMSVRTTGESGSSRRPKTGVLYGYKDGTYRRVTTFDFGSTHSNLPFEEFLAGSSEFFTRLVVQVTSIFTDGSTKDAVAIKNIRFFGTREQGASTLHNGELSLTRNLTVPRIGPPLDADDTPRRDRLVVEYNTTTNPTENGVVKDTSGRGFDGLFYGSASYDATEKMITLSDGTDDYVESGKTILARGTPQHSFSFWVKPSDGDHNDTDNHYLVVWGSETVQNKWSAVALSNDGALAQAYHSSAKRTADKVLPSSGTWYHVAVVVKTTSATTAANRDVDFYINGSLYTNTYDIFGSQNTDSAYGLDWGTGTYTSVRIGSLHASTEDSSSSLSTIKLYDVALTADEVKRLYDMGRCDEGHHVVNFSKTRVSIGLGDGEVSDALLNVGGIPYGPGARPIFSAYEHDDYSVTSSGYITLGNTFVNGLNCYDTSTGKFTAPLSGIYCFIGNCTIRSGTSGNGDSMWNFHINDTGWNPTSSGRPIVYQHIDTGTNHQQTSAALIWSLNKNDTVRIHAHTVPTNSNQNWGQGYGRFLGFLLS